MFDIDAGKLLILGVIALVVLGPKELPRVMRQVGNALGKMRRMASEFQNQFMDAMKESEMEELKKDMQKMADQAKVDIDYNPMSDTDRQIREAIDGKPARPPNGDAAARSHSSSTPIPEDPDPDNRIYAADIGPANPSQPSSQAAGLQTSAPADRAHASSAPSPAATEAPARKAGEA